MAARRILVVDDQREITRMIRSALETLGQGYVIVEVPSGEEAVLEIRRGGIDLLVTDVRLPGISGLDLIKRLRKANDKAQAIVISGYPSAQFEAEAKRLGVTSYFSKPLRMEDFLQSVQTALGEKPTVGPAVPSSAQPQEPGIAARLSTLRRDLAANAVFLVDLDGKVVVRAGDITKLDMDPVLAHLMTAFSAALKVCKLLGGLIPTNVHFFDGDDYDVYAANVGQYFALVIIFDGERGAGQMGPVMRYGRQCADDLLNSLVVMGIAVEPALPSGFAAGPLPALSPEPLAIPVPEQAAAPVALAVAAAASAPKPPPKPLSEQEIKALEEAAKKVKEADAASFWDTAMAEAAAESVRPDTLSWEQAEKLGLIPKK
ncbi:MAG: response regulator [Anaerolineales bacterium]